MPSEHYVYAISIDGVVRYIGATKDKRRFYWHKLVARTYRYRNQPLHPALAEAMERDAVIDFDVIKQGLTKRLAHMFEAKVIASYPEGQLLNCDYRIKHPGMTQKWADPEYERRMSAVHRKAWEKRRS
jgi:hypothetical protein